ncbi:MAG: hypothetical protein Q9227_000967 [Pyrenula ochraceoflavens]
MTLTMDSDEDDEGNFTSQLTGYDPHNNRRMWVSLRRKGTNDCIADPRTIYQSRGPYCQNVLKLFRGQRQDWPYQSGLANRLSKERLDGIYICFETNHPFLQCVTRLGTLEELESSCDCRVCKLVTYAVQNYLSFEMLQKLKDRPLFAFPVLASSTLALRPYHKSDALKAATYLKLGIELQGKDRLNEKGVNLELTDLSLSLADGDKGLALEWLARTTQWDNTYVNMNTVKGWIKDCEQTHQDVCMDHIQPLEDDLPLYLIDCLERKVVPAPKRAKYLALSYVWGSTQHFQTTLRHEHGTSGLSFFGNNLGELPQTIEDAFSVTLGIGERYLWVDAYCLSQDAQERSTSLRNMHKIYRSALLTIFALSNWDADEGLPGISPRAGISRASIPLNGGVRLTAFVNNSLQDAFNNSFWSTRGWCFQEGFFSSRCLCFTEEEAFFWCRNRIFFETAEDSERISGFSFDDEGTDRKPPMHICLGDIWDFSEYADLVSVYRTRNLTFESDVINAFAGVMSHLKEKYDIGLPAGLPYNHDLPRALAWEFWGSDSMNNRLRLKGIPSWSWAGWTGQVRYRWERFMPNWGHQQSLFLDWDLAFGDGDDGCTVFESRSTRDLSSMYTNDAEGAVQKRRYETVRQSKSRLLRLYTFVARLGVRCSEEDESGWTIHEQTGEEVEQPEIRSHDYRNFMPFSTQFDAQDNTWKENVQRKGADFLFLLAWAANVNRYPGRPSYVTTMVVNWVNDVAYRVAIVHLPMDVWNRAKPTQKLVMLR